MPIRILDAATVGRIAAGEVVERPASVAKELFENSLDAGATSVTVEIRQGGIDYLRVTDNGSGIAPEEVRIAFQNHATSKLHTADELTDIRTMGFRGEALASISAVSKVEMTTRKRGTDFGVKAVVEAGRIVSINEVGCPEGTTVIVKDLFYNTPVRRAFLKKPNYEGGVVVETISKLLLGNPEVSVRFISSGKTLFHSFGDGNLRHAAMAVYGRDAAGALLDVDAMEGGLRVSGLIGIGDQGRPTRSQQSFFINGRSVKCLMLSQALENATRGRVTVGMHPMCCLNLTMPPQTVDVNVHPSKLEVRFRDEEAMRMSLDAIFNTAFPVETMLDVKAVEAEKPAIAPRPEAIIERIGDDPRFIETPEKPMIEKPSVAIAAENRSEPIRATMREGAEISEIFDFSKTFEPVEMENLGLETPLYRIIGQVFDTYLIIQTENAMVLIDQHAAHERILYEKYASSLNDGNASQKLLVPLIIEASKKELAQVENSMELISSAGFEVEPFGEREIALRAVPFVLGKSEIRPFFMEMLDRLDQLKNAQFERRRQEIMQLACKHAIKGSRALSNDEIVELIKLMADTQAPSTCPHGRPVLRAFTKLELDKMFKRIQ